MSRSLNITPGWLEKLLISRKSGLFEGYFPFFIFATVLLTGNFSLNILSLANSVWFERHDKASEALVVARLVEDRDHVAGSYYSMLGIYSNSTTLDGRTKYALPFRLYAGELPVTTNYNYLAYNRQYGGQAALLGFVDRGIDTLLGQAVGAGILRGGLLENIRESKISLLHLFVGFINAIIVAWFLLWFASEFGLGVGWWLLGVTLLSPCLTVFGRNLYWFMGFWFLPAVLSAWLFRLFDGRLASRSIIPLSSLAIGVFVANLLTIGAKSLMGYEFLSTVTVAQLTVVVYYATKWGWGGVTQLLWLGWSGVAAIIGFLGAYSMHFSRLSPILGDTTDARVKFLRELFLYRAMGKGPSPSGLDSRNLFIIIGRYLLLVFNLFPPYILLIVPILVVAFHVLRRNPANAALKPLAVSTLFSFLAPLSWFVIARNHAAESPHLNYVLWHLPPIFFGMALIGAWFLQKYRFELKLTPKTGSGN